MCVILQILTYLWLHLMNSFCSFHYFVKGLNVVKFSDDTSVKVLK